MKLVRTGARRRAVRLTVAGMDRDLPPADPGWLVPGAAADMTVFDAAEIGRAGTYERPDGIVDVLLGGEPVITAGRFDGVRRGRMPRR